MYTFQYLWVSQMVGGKSHFGGNTKFGDIADIFNKYRSRSPKVDCKNDEKFSKEHLFWRTFASSCKNDPK